MVRFFLSLFLAVGLAACTELPPVGAPVASVPAPAAAPVPVDNALVAFAQVKRAVQPVAEDECRRSAGTNARCDFRILIDDRPDQPPNAFQTLDDLDRPVIIFTLSLLEDTRNLDEIAFVMGHEAAHHIAGHIPRQRVNAATGAVVFAGLATLTGGNAADIRRAQEIGATVGARTYSKEFELEADALGTIIAARAGFSPVRGAEFFNRIPDPGDRFLGSHPPNAARIEVVRRTAAGL